MSPVSFGPSDVKNPRSHFWGPVPESFWLTKALIFDLDWLLQEEKNAHHPMPDHPQAESVILGLKETFRLLRSFEIRLAMTSNLPQAQVVPELVRLKLADDFDCIRCAEELPAHKPNPELNFNVMETLGVRPIKAVALETSFEGIQAAKSADLFCITTVEWEGKADLSLSSFTVEPILHLLERIDRLKRCKLNLI